MTWRKREVLHIYIVIAAGFTCGYFVEKWLAPSFKEASVARFRPYNIFSEKYIFPVSTLALM